jgi:hypothetical protein
VSAVDEAGVRQALAVRIRELGGESKPSDIALRYLAFDPAPGCRLFHASWGGGQREGHLSGLIRDGERPDTYPGQILAKVFRRWLETEGALPDASGVATVCVYVLDPAGRNRPILAEEDRLRWVGPESRERVATPRPIEVAGLPGVSFWWVRPEGDSEVRVYLVEGENVRIEEVFGRDHPTTDHPTRGQ